MNRLRVCFGVVLCLMMLVAGFAYGADEKAGDGGKGLFEDKCSRCHPIDRPKSKVKTADDWKSTVTRMRNVNRAPITDAEAKTIIDYLEKYYGLR